VAEVSETGYLRLDLGCGSIDVRVLGPLPVRHGRYNFSVPGLRMFDCAY